MFKRLKKLRKLIRVIKLLKSIKNIKEKFFQSEEAWFVIGIIIGAIFVGMSQESLLVLFCLFCLFSVK